MSKLLTILVIVVSLNGCSLYNTIEPMCDNKAIFTASSWYDVTGEQVRIAYGPRKQGYHVQAQRMSPDGEWQWLIYVHPWVKPGPRDSGFNPEKYYGLNEFWELWRIMMERKYTKKLVEKNKWN